MKFSTLVFVVITLITLEGCNREDPCEVPSTFDVDQAQLDADILEIDKYLADSSINAEVHSSGLRYVIDNPGAGSTPNLCDFVVVGYTGKLLDGTIFDSTGANDAARFSLGQLIPGWQAGVPLVKEEGEITLYIPSPLGYGERSFENIPSNSILIFDIKLFAVQ